MYNITNFVLNFASIFTVKSVSSTPFKLFQHHHKLGIAVLLQTVTAQSTETRSESSQRYSGPPLECFLGRVSQYTALERALLRFMIVLKLENIRGWQRACRFLIDSFPRGFES